jgi:hypothetical protein
MNSKGVGSMLTEYEEVSRVLTNSHVIALPPTIDLEGTLGALKRNRGTLPVDGPAYTYRDGTAQKYGLLDGCVARSLGQRALDSHNEALLEAMSKVGVVYIESSIGDLDKQKGYKTKFESAMRGALEFWKSARGGAEKLKADHAKDVRSTLRDILLDERATDQLRAAAFDSVKATWDPGSAELAAADEGIKSAKTVRALKSEVDKHGGAYDPFKVSSVRSVNDARNLVARLGFDLHRFEKKIASSRYAMLAWNDHEVFDRMTERTTTRIMGTLEEAKVAYGAETPVPLMVAYRRGAAHAFYNTPGWVPKMSRTALDSIHGAYAKLWERTDGIQNGIKADAMASKSDTTNERKEKGRLRDVATELREKTPSGVAWKTHHMVRDLKEASKMNRIIGTATDARAFVSNQQTEKDFCVETCVAVIRDRIALHKSNLRAIKESDRISLVDMLGDVPSYTGRVEISKHLTRLLFKAQKEHGIGTITVPLLPDETLFESSSDPERLSYAKFLKVHTSLKGHAVMDERVVSMLTYLLENEATEWTATENSQSRRNAGETLRRTYITWLLRDLLPIVRADAALKGALAPATVSFGMMKSLFANIRKAPGPTTAAPPQESTERINRTLRETLAESRMAVFLALRVGCVVAVEKLVGILAGADKGEVRRVLLGAVSLTDKGTLTEYLKAKKDSRALHARSSFGAPVSGTRPASFSDDDVAYLDKLASLDHGYYWFKKPASYGYAQLEPDHLRLRRTKETEDALRAITGDTDPVKAQAEFDVLEAKQRSHAMSVVFYIDGEKLCVARPKVTGAYCIVGKIRAMGSSEFLDLGYPDLAIEADTMIDDSAYAFIGSLCAHASVELGLVVEGEDGKRTLTPKGLGALHTSLATHASIELALRAVSRVLFMKINTNGTLVLSSASPCDLFSITDGDLVCVHDVRSRRASACSAFGAHI